MRHWITSFQLLNREIEYGPCSEESQSSSVQARCGAWPLGAVQRNAPLSVFGAGSSWLEGRRRSSVTGPSSWSKAAIVAA